MFNNFSIIVPFYNESPDLQKTIDSLLALNYLNKELIFVNDFSTDNSLEIIEENRFNLEKKYNIVKIINKLNNINDIRLLTEPLDLFCSAENIICILDGGDWITDIDALNIINDVYNQTSCDILWTKQRWNYTSYNISGALPESANPYKYKWVTSHLKTFRKSLYDNVNPINFQDDEGKWIRWARDQALFLPMLTIAKKKIFLPLTMYHYNFDFEDANLNGGAKNQAQMRTEQMLRTRGFVV